MGHSPSLLLAPAESWGTPSSPYGGLWPHLHYNKIEYNIPPRCLDLRTGLHLLGKNYLESAITRMIEEQYNTIVTVPDLGHTPGIVQHLTFWAFYLYLKVYHNLHHVQ